MVAALGAEARTLGPRATRGAAPYMVNDGTLVAVSGIGAAAAAAAARGLVDAGAVALVSWGMAGGLSPELPAGTICLPSEVVSRDGASFATSHHWRELMAAAIAPLRAVVGGRLLTSNSTIEDAAAKAAAFRDTGALAVDMESLAVAEVAAAHALPFLVVRAIVDTAADAIPGVVLLATRVGEVEISTLLAGLLRRPAELPAVIRLMQRYRAARGALLAVARTGALAPLVLGSPHRTV